MMCPRGECDGGGWLYTNRPDGTRSARRCVCLEDRIASETIKAAEVTQRKPERKKEKEQRALGIATAPWRPL